MCGSYLKLIGRGQANGLWAWNCLQWSSLAAGRKKLLLNLEGVPYIDSAGLGEVVRTYTTVSRQGGSLKLLNLTKRIEDLLSITKLLTVFETFDSETEAVQSYT